MHPQAVFQAMQGREHVQFKQEQQNKDQTFINTRHLSKCVHTVVLTSYGLYFQVI